MIKGEDIVAAADAILHGSDIPFNVGYMFVLGAEIEIDLGHQVLQGFELGIGMDCLDAESARFIFFDDPA